MPTSEYGQRIKPSEIESANAPNVARVTPDFRRENEPSEESACCNAPLIEHFTCERVAQCGKCLQCAYCGPRIDEAEVIREHEAQKRKKPRGSSYLSETLDDFRRHGFTDLSRVLVAVERDQRERNSYAFGQLQA